MTLTTRTITNAGAPLCATDGAILANATITFALVDHIGVRSDAWDAVTSERVGGDPILATTDASGEFTVALWPNSRGATKGHKYWGWTAGAINLLFFWQTDHCLSAYRAEVERRQYPEAYREAR